MALECCRPASSPSLCPHWPSSSQVQDKTTSKSSFVPEQLLSISPMWFFLFYCNVYWRAYRNGLLRRLTPLLSTCRLTELSVALPSPTTTTHSVTCLPIVIVCLSQSQWVGGLPRLPFCDWPQWTATHAAIFIYFLSCPSSSVTGWLFDCHLIP